MNAFHLLAGAIALGLARPDAAAAEHYLFAWDDRGDRGRIEVVVAGSRIRIDQPMRKFAAIYDRSTGVVTGLEVRDGTWWQFVWPELRDRVGRSTVPAERLKDLSVAGMASVDFERPPTPRDEGDGLSILWRPTGEKRSISGLPCEQWHGEVAGGGDLEAWVTEQAVPGLVEGVARAGEAGEPLDLVVMRPVLPREFADAVKSLEKAKVTPLEVEWGDRGSRSRVTFLRHEQKDVGPSFFDPPKNYRKTSLREVEMLQATGDEKEKPVKEGVRGLQPIRRPEIGPGGVLDQP